MSTIIQGFDYDNFNPEGVTYPPNGDYTLAAIGIDDKPSKDGHRMLTIHFEIASGEQRKQQFRIGYYIGNPNTEQAKWAFEGLGRLYFAATGQRPTSRGFKFEDIQFKPFTATFDASPNAKGDIFAKIKNLKPVVVDSTGVQTTTAVAAWGAPAA